MTAPLRASAFADVVAVDGRGHRSPQTMLLIDKRNALLIEAARFFPGASDREAARRIRNALSIYRDGRGSRQTASNCFARRSIADGSTRCCG